MKAVAELVNFGNRNHKTWLGLLLALCCLLAGCDKVNRELATGRDRQSASGLVGIWYRNAEQPAEGGQGSVTLNTWLTLSSNGQFHEFLKESYTDGRMLEYHGEGQWFVTGGQLRMHYAKFQGDKIPRNAVIGMRMFSLMSVSDTAFTIASPLSSGREIATVIYVRTREAGKEP